MSFFSGCEDTYWASIDCQWIDITGVLPGTYIFRVSINAEFKVAESDFDNNALICQLDYNGVSVLARNCRLELFYGLLAYLTKFAIKRVDIYILSC